MRCSNVKSKILVGIIVPLISALFVVSPAYADKISINFDSSNVDLHQSGKIYKGNNIIQVRNDNDYGFSLSMYAKNSNLVNGQNSSYKIASISGNGKPLGVNQWGYTLDENMESFRQMPASADKAAPIANVTRFNRGNCSDLETCNIRVTFGANINATSVASGGYSTTIVYTIVSKPKPSNCSYDNEKERCVSLISEQPSRLNPYLPVAMLTVPKRNQFGDLIGGVTSIWSHNRYNYNYNAGRWAYLARINFDEWLSGHRYDIKPDVIFVYIPNVDILADGYIRYYSSGYWVNSDVFSCSLNRSKYRYSGINGDLPVEELKKAKKIASILGDIIGSPCDTGGGDY